MQKQIEVAIWYGVALDTVRHSIAAGRLWTRGMGARLAQLDLDDVSKLGRPTGIAA